MAQPCVSSRPKKPTAVCMCLVQQQVCDQQLFQSRVQVAPRLLCDSGWHVEPLRLVQFKGSHEVMFAARRGVDRGGKRPAAAWQEVAGTKRPRPSSVIAHCSADQKHGKHHLTGKHVHTTPLHPQRVKVPTVFTCMVRRGSDPRHDRFGQARACLGRQESAWRHPVAVARLYSRFQTRSGFLPIQ